MAKNLIPEIAHMLGVELGEEFKIKGYEEWFYKFDNDRVLMFKHNDDVKMSVAPVSVYVAFLTLLRGEYEIIKLPWKPKMYEEYWTFGKLGKQWIVGTRSWKELPYEILLLNKGWLYRTREEAQQNLPKVAKEYNVPYSLT